MKRGLVVQSCHRHSTAVIRAIDDVGAQDVIPKGEDLSAEETEDMVARLEGAAFQVGVELRTGRLAVL